MVLKMRKKANAKPKIGRKNALKDASTQTDTYVEYMPLPIPLDIKSEDESASDGEWHGEDGAVVMFDTVKVEVDNPELMDTDSRSYEPYSAPVEQLYFDEKSMIIAVQQSIPSIDAQINAPPSQQEPQPQVPPSLELALKTSKKRKESKKDRTNDTKPKKSKKPKKDRLQKATSATTELKLVECSLCKFTCKRPSHLKRHMLMHTGERPHKCEHCPKSFAQKTDLNRHMGTHAALYNYHCDSCGRGFSTELESTKHKQNCKTKRYICDECNYMTFSIGNLKLHQRRHTGERPFSCPVCDRRFTRVAHLNQHVKLHAEEFEHHCAMCGRGYNDLDEMIRHEETCKNRQFQCHICRDVHYRMDNLKRHIKTTHTGEKEILCEYCSKQFPAKSSLTKHIRHRHPERL